MRRPIAANLTPLLLFLVILVSLVACSTSASTTSFPTVPAPAAMPPTTGVLQLEPTLTVAPPLTTGSIPDATLVPTTLQLTEKQDSVAAEASAIPCGLAPDGVVVSAWVDDEDLAQGTVINGSYKLLVHQLDSQLAGKVISFRVGAVAAGQTAVWTQGSADELNLTAASRKDILVIPNEINESGPEGRRVTIPIPPHLFVGTVALICPKGRDGRDSELTAEVGNSPTPARTYPPTFAKRTVAPIPNTLAPTPTPTPIAKPSSVEQDTRELEELIHALVNTERRKHQLTPLISDIELALIARGHSQDMAAKNQQIALLKIENNLLCDPTTITHCILDQIKVDFEKQSCTKVKYDQEMDFLLQFIRDNNLDSISTNIFDDIEWSWSETDSVLTSDGKQVERIKDIKN